MSARIIKMKPVPEEEEDEDETDSIDSISNAAAIAHDDDDDDDVCSHIPSVLYDNAMENDIDDKNDDESEVRFLDDEYDYHVIEDICDGNRDSDLLDSSSCLLRKTASSSCVRMDRDGDGNTDCNTSFTCTTTKNSRRSIEDATIIEESEAEPDDDCDTDPALVVVEETDEICVLGEVVCAHRLTRHDPRDDAASDSQQDSLQAFCVVRYGSSSGSGGGTETGIGKHQKMRVVHRTLPANAGPSWRNPVWSMSTRSLFTLTTTPRQLARNDVVVSVWWKRPNHPSLILTNEKTIYVGEVKLSGGVLMQHANEQLYTLPLHDGEDQGFFGLDHSLLHLPTRGKISLRFRLATPGDEEVVQLLTKVSARNAALLSNPGCKHLFHILHAPPFPDEIEYINSHREHHKDNGNNITNDNDANENTKDDDNDNDKPTRTIPRPIAKVLTERDESSIISANLVQSVFNVFNSNTHFDKETNQRKTRAKPGADPMRVKETTWLSKQMFENETLRPSVHWIEAGSGTLGKVFVEILSCHGLPNVDMGGAVGNLTDPFVCAIFEDAMVQTPVIYDELSPHWLPWTERAFIFGMMHPASVLHLGVFDYDIGPLIPHDPIGRVTVNVAQFQRDTDYILSYNLHKSSNITDRTCFGTIRIRIRVSYMDEKKALLEALAPRPRFHLNVRREKSHAVVQFTCFGDCNRKDKFEMTVTRSYINEILDYKSYLSYCISDSIRSLLFWRGQVLVWGLNLPLHSFLLFLWGTVLLERPQLFPSFLLLCVAWILLATQTYRRQHPSPWQRCPSFWHYAKILWYGQSTLYLSRIHEQEGSAQAAAYEQAWEDRLAKDLKVAEARKAFQDQMKMFDESIHTKNIPVWDPDLLIRLARYQEYLRVVCRYFRQIKIVLTWEESILSFWITACFLVGGLVSLVLPWSFILYRTAWLFVYGILGPHMMIVGRIVLHKDSTEFDDKAKIQDILESFRKQSHGAQLRHQVAVKLKDVLRLSFGQYSTLTPAMNLCRHYDYPLSKSHARLNSFPNSVTGEEPNLSILPRYVPGQKCNGIMIPRCGPSAARFQEELVHLDVVRCSIKDCIQRIQDEENSDLMKRLRLLGNHELDMPEAIGFELVSLLNNTTTTGSSAHHGKSDPEPETNIIIGEASLHLHAASDVVVMASRRKPNNRLSMLRASAQVFEAVYLDNDDRDDVEEVPTVRLDPSSFLLSNSDPRLAIMETSERHLSVNNSFRKSARFDRRASSRALSSFSINTGALPSKNHQEKDVGENVDGVEIVWCQASAEPVVLLTS